MACKYFLPFYSFLLYFVDCEIFAYWFIHFVLLLYRSLLVYCRPTLIFAFVSFFLMSYPKKSSPRLASRSFICIFSSKSFTKCVEVSQKIKNRTTIWPGIPSSVYIPNGNENRILKRHLHFHAYCSSIYHNQDMETSLNICQQRSE